VNDKRREDLPELDQVLMEGAEARERQLLWATTGRLSNPLLERLLARIEDPEALWPQEFQDRLMDLVHQAVHQAIDTHQSDINEMLRARLYQLVRELDEGE
jgi:hypothetical protein